MNKSKSNYSFRWSQLLVSLVVAIVIYTLGRGFSQVAWIPLYHEWPVVISPLITLIISVLVFSEYIEKEWGNSLLHYSTSLVIVSLCALLASIPGWQAHLILMFLIFIVFLVWDIRMLRDASFKTHRDTRQEVLAGHAYINIPSLVAIGIAGIYLFYGDIHHLIHVHPDEVADQLKENDITNKYTANPLEMFTSGLVAFHLVVASASYAVVSYARTGELEKLWGAE